MAPQMRICIKFGRHSFVHDLPTPNFRPSISQRTVIKRKEKERREIGRGKEKERERENLRTRILKEFCILGLIFENGFNERFNSFITNYSLYEE